MTAVTVPYLSQDIGLFDFVFFIHEPDSDPDSRPLGLPTDLHPSLCPSSAILTEPISKVLAGRINAFFLCPFGEKLSTLLRQGAGEGAVRQAAICDREEGGKGPLEESVRLLIEESNEAHLRGGLWLQRA